MTTVYVPAGTAQQLVASATCEDLTLLTLTAAGLGSKYSQVQNNYGARYLNLGINITAISGTTPTLTVTILGVDAASGKAYTILASAALNAVAFTLLQVGPALTAVANSVANACVPHTWYVQAAVGGTGPSVTATIGASMN